jgi:hypothetical protein
VAACHSKALGYSFPRVGTDQWGLTRRTEAGDLARTVGTRPAFPSTSAHISPPTGLLGSSEQRTSAKWYPQWGVGGHRRQHLISSVRFRPFPKVRVHAVARPEWQDTSDGPTSVIETWTSGNHTLAKTTHEARTICARYQRSVHRLPLPPPRSLTRYSSGSTKRTANASLVGRKAPAFMASVTTASSPTSSGGRLLAHQEQGGTARIRTTRADVH